MNSTTLTVVILTKNEAIHIGRAIQSLSRIPCNVDVHVVDSGSTDNTRAIAAASGARVVQHPFENYARQFQWALDNLSLGGDWIMRLDADEVIPDALAEEIATRIAVAPKSVHGFALNRKHIFWDRWLRHGGRYPLTLLRIWRSGRAQIEDRWMDEHMILTSDGSIVTLDNPFEDRNLNDLTFFTDKHNKYATREAVDVLLRQHNLHHGVHDVAHNLSTRQARLRRFMKFSFYYQLPYPIAVSCYLLFRLVLQRGILDGLPGITYHSLQAGWYRFLVGAKIYEYDRELQKCATAREKMVRLHELTGLSI